MRMLEDPAQERLRPGGPGWLALAPLAALAVTAVFAMALVDGATATSTQELHRLAFGMPQDWLIQNQEAYDPPYPYAASPASPWENPTSVALAPLVVDVLGVLAVLVVVWLGVRLALRRR